jgi:hypothetical protein
MESFVDAFPCAGMVFVNTGGALNMDLTEVAFFLGFAGLSTFSRSFKTMDRKITESIQKSCVTDRMEGAGISACGGQTTG